MFFLSILLYISLQHQLACTWYKRLRVVAFYCLIKVSTLSEQGREVVKSFL